jgi:hypothetical protein
LRHLFIFPRIVVIWLRHIQFLQFSQTVVIICFRYLFMCCNNLDDYLINYDQLLYVLHMNSIKNSAFTGSEAAGVEQSPLTKIVILFYSFG